jgi:hypothetical protein
VADDGEGLAVVGADAVEDFGMADDFVAGLGLVLGTLGFETGEDLKDARDAAEAGDDELLAGEYGGRGAQVGVDGEVRGQVAGRFVFGEGLFKASMRRFFQSICKPGNRE